MKKHVYGIWFLILLYSTPITMAQGLDEGFFGIPWKTSINRLKEFSHLNNSGPISYYTNPNELHKIFDKDVPGVIYGFYEGELFAVFIKIDSLELFSSIRKHLTSKYGDPDKSMTAKVEQTIYKWKHGPVKIKLKILQADGTMKLVFYYTPLSSKVNEDKLEAQQRNTSQLFPTHKDTVPQKVPLFEF
jgi:hypothetical protein